MLFIFVTCFSFIFFLRYSLPIKPLPPWSSEMRLISFYFWKDLSILFPFAKLFKNILLSPKAAKKHFSNTHVSTSNNNQSMLIEGMSVLDLPNLALECILERLEPDGLCKMACVCTYLRDMCLSDHLWENHMKKRWGRIIGQAAYKQWHLHISTKKESSYFLAGDKGRGLLIGYLSKLWPIMLIRPKLTSFDDHDDSKMMNLSSQLPIDSIVSCYRALETGKFWFPAQVFNREV